MFDVEVEEKEAHLLPLYLLVTDKRRSCNIVSITHDFDDLINAHPEMLGVEPYVAHMHSCSLGAAEGQ
ncbi:MAG: hypothetical protein JWO07_325 [Candidatus Saccharibacteria bacterium]|nr:hypothetical protein [Candidatus Saccharibacteria bacterium]